MAAQAAERFRAEFGRDPQVVVFAPGRVNLIGAHLDYSGGDVLPVAVDLGVYLAAGLRDDRQIRLRSVNFDAPVDVDSDQLAATARSEDAWASYPLGVWREFAAATDAERGVDLVFGGDLPIASGMSSSAAVEVATALALNELHDSSLARLEIARMAHRAEKSYVGVHCGIMDQFASALSRADHALLLHCVDQTFEFVPFDAAAVEVMVMDTRKPRTLATSVFNDRVRECSEAHAILSETLGPKPCLAAFQPADLEAVGESVLHGVHRQRARHVVTEMQRVAEGIAGLRAGEVARLGAMLTASHRSTSTDYAVSCPELDFLTAAACEVDGVYGARLTGAGFGGCAIALVAPGRSGAVVEAVSDPYRDVFGLDAGFRVLRAGTGARTITG